MHTISGVVSIYNSKYETGSTKYVQLAQIEDKYGRAQPTTTDVDGKFSLIYLGLADGDGVTLNVTKMGLQVVDQHSLEAVIGQKKQLNIYLADPKYISDYRARIFEVGKTSNQKALESELKTTQGLLIYYRNRNIKDSILWAQEKIQYYRNMQEQGDKLAQQITDRYLTLNYDDGSPTYQASYKLFLEGKLDSALIVFDQGRVLDQAQSFKKDENDLIRRRNEIQIEQIQLDKRRSTLSQDLIQGIILHQSNFQPDSVTKYYNALTEVEPSANNFYDYASFLESIGHYEQSFQMYETARTRTSDTAAIAKILNSQVLVLFNTRKFRSVIQYSDSTLALLQPRLGKPNFDTLLYSGIFHHRAMAYDLLNDANNADICYLTAYKIIKTIKPSTAEIVEDLALLCNDYGLFLNKYEQHDAIDFFLESVELFKKLLFINHERYEVKYAACLTNLSKYGIFKDPRVNEKQLLLEAVNILMKYLNKTSNKTDDLYSVALTLLGNYYLNNRQYDSAKLFFVKGYDIRKRLVNDNHQEYRYRLASSASFCGELYLKIKQYSKAKEFILESNQIITILYKEDKRAHFDNYVRYRLQLATLYDSLQNRNLQKTTLFEILSESRSASDFYEMKFALPTVQFEIAKFYLDIKRKDSASLYGDTAISYFSFYNGQKQMASLQLTEALQFILYNNLAKKDSVFIYQERLVQSFPELIALHYIIDSSAWGSAAFNYASDLYNHNEIEKAGMYYYLVLEVMNNADLNTSAKEEQIIETHIKLAIINKRKQKLIDSMSEINLAKTVFGQSKHLSKEKKHKFHNMIVAVN